MTFHEEYNQYREAGFQQVSDMITLSEAGICAEHAIKYASCGFAGNKNAIIQLNSEFTSWGIEQIEKYSKAGFHGNLEAMLELKDDVDGGFAMLLAEHGLSGDYESMQKIACITNSNHFEGVLLSISNQLYGDPNIHPKIPQHYKKATEIRKQHAKEVDAKDIALLIQYDIIDHKEAFLEGRQRAKTLKAELEQCPKYQKKLSLFEKLDEQDEPFTEEEHDLYCRLTEEMEEKENRSNFLYQRRVAYDEMITKAFLILRDQGREEFEKQYEPKEKWKLVEL